MVTTDWSWFDGPTRAHGLELVASDDDNARHAIGATGLVRWSVRAERSVDSDGVSGHATWIEAPDLAAPVPPQGSVPVAIEIDRDERAHAHLGGDSSPLGLIVSLASGIWSARRTTRREASLSPIERVHVEVNPPGLVRDDTVALIACWPGDACHGGSVHESDGGTTRARGVGEAIAVRVDASPWRPLRLWTNTFGDPGALAHALHIWRALLTDVVSPTGLVIRDPDTIAAPTAAEIRQATDALAVQLRSSRRNRR